MEEMKKKAREMFDEKFKELNGKTEIWKGNRPPSHTDIKSFIDKIIDLTVSKERERILEVIKSAKAYVVKIPEIDPSFGDLIDADLNFIEHKEGNVLFRHELINLINTK